MVEKRLLLLFFLLHFAYFSGDIYAQSPGGKQQPAKQNVPENAHLHARHDSSKVRRIGRGHGILDDTSRVVYGPHTTTHFYLKNWFEIDTTLYLTDTSVINFQRYKFPSKHHHLYHDLGNVGTPIHPFFYRFSEHPGKQLGQNALKAYHTDEQALKYYDSRSPYADWYYAQGGSGRAILDIRMARNVNPRFNVAFRYFRLSSRFMRGQRPQQRNNLHAQGETFQLYSHFSSPKKRYRILGRISSGTHKLQESGGVNLDVLLNDSTGLYDLFKAENRGAIINRLQKVNTEGKRKSLFLYQQFSVLGTKEVLQVFQQTEAVNRQYAFLDENLKTNKHFYLSAFDTALSRSAHLLRFEQVGLKQGLKGKQGRFFYAAWFSYLAYAQSTEYEPVTTGKAKIFIPLSLPSERFLGAQLQYRLGKTNSLLGGKINAKLKKQLGGEANTYYVGFKNRHLEAFVRSGSYAPSQMQRYYLSDLMRWKNPHFLYEKAARGFLKLRYERKKYHISLSFEDTRLKNYLYFDTLARPAQAQKVLRYQQVGLAFDLKAGFIRQQANLYYTKTKNNALLRMPEYLINYQIFFEKMLFKEAIFTQIGLDFHWQSALLARSYMPVTQQFYLQNKYESGNYLLTDLFLNFRINRVRMFFKIANLLQGAFGRGGYYTTPYYMTQVRELGFGVRWLLFD